MESHKSGFSVPPPMWVRVGKRYVFKENKIQQQVSLNKQTKNRAPSCQRREEPGTSTAEPGDRGSAPLAYCLRMLGVGGVVSEEGGQAHHGTLGNGLPELASGPQKGP